VGDNVDVSRMLLMGRRGTEREHFAARKLRWASAAGQERVVADARPTFRWSSTRLGMLALTV